MKLEHNVPNLMTRNKCHSKPLIVMELAHSQENVKVKHGLLIRDRGRIIDTEMLLTKQFGLLLK